MDQISDIVLTLGAVGALSTAPDWDHSSTEAVLLAFAEFVEAEVTPGNGPSDRAGCRIVEGRVRLPDPLPQTYRRYIELGWHLLGLPSSLGGIGAPPAVCCAATEMLSGANHAFQMLVGLVPAAAAVITRFGSADLKPVLLDDLVAGTALATMCLSEADAGSDLAAIRTAARQDGEGRWTLHGDKIFISGGDQDLSDTIVHLVLARTGAASEGVHGLSLFACPARRAEGSPNGVELVRIEEKLGLHASPTCHLRFAGAQAHLLGSTGEGLKAMFVMMNHARLDVAMQGVAHADRAHRLASAYAATRRQGGRAIAAHGDVSRMLSEMEALSLGSRAMAYRAAIEIDNADLAAFLTPVCKVFCTDMASRVADTGIQVLGGYGYLPEYGLEQIWRDARVTRLYEGTNGVLAMSLVRRLLGGASEAAFLAEIEQSLHVGASEVGCEALRALRQHWLDAANAVRARRDPGMVAAPLMALAGLVYFAACWLRLEAAAPAGAQAQRMARLGHFVRTALLPDGVALRIRCSAPEQCETGEER